MATTGIWKVTKRLDHVIDYVMNPEKTIKDDDNKCYRELHGFEEFENLGFNTEESCYVSALNCSTHRTYKDMMATKEQYGKTGGILGFHAFQSFKEGEVTPDMAHKIGLKLAEEMWGDRFEVVVTTHVHGTKHIHNHFVINSVSFKDGKKYYDNRENLAKFRHLSDSLCQEYGLSVLEEKPCPRSKINFANYYNGYIKKTNYHTMAKEDLDRAIGMAYSYRDFENLMSKMGYEITNRYGKLSIRRNPFKKNIRIERSFGSDYSISEIEKRIETTNITRVPFVEVFNPNFYKELKKYRKEKSKGMHGTYKYYCFILKSVSKQNKHKFISPYLREEIKKMDEISKQSMLLSSHEIKTGEQLLFYKDNLNTKISDLEARRHNLWIKYKRCKNEALKCEIKEEIDSIKKELIPIRKEVVLCDGILKRSGVVEKNIEEFENNLGKEKIKDEF